MFDQITADPSKNKGERTRSFIIERSAPIFNTQGFAGTSMKDIMQATGLEKGGIYNHFGSKRDIALAAFDYAIAMTYQRIRVTIESIEHHADRLIALCDVFSTFLLEPVVEGGCPLMNMAIDADDTEPILRDAVKRAMSYLDAIIHAIIDEGKGVGYIRQDVNAPALATVMIAILEGALMLSKLHDDDSHLEHANAHLALYINAFVRAE